MHLANNSSAITAWTNDFEFNSYFTRQVEALGNKGDILFLITTGGGNRDNGASMNLVYESWVGLLLPYCSLIFVDIV